MLGLNPELEASMSRSSIFVLSILSCAPLLAQEAAVKGMPLKVRCLMGLETVKRNASGMLTLHEEAMEFSAGQAKARVPVKSIDDIFSGAEMTQAERCRNRRRRKNNDPAFVVRGLGGVVGFAGVCGSTEWGRENFGVGDSDRTSRRGRCSHPHGVSRGDL